MVRTKHTARKTSVGLPVARRPHVCQECRRQIEDVSNFRRHMVIVHKKNVDGTDADAATVSRFSQYAKRGPRTRAQSTADAQPTPDANADDPRPSTSARSSIPTRRRRRRLKSIAVVPQSPTMSPIDTQSAATSFDVADDLILSSSSCDADSADDFFIDITDEEAVADTPNTEATPTTSSPTVRVPTRPLPVAAPRHRVARLQIPAVVRPSAPTAPAAKRRRLEMAPSVLAQRVIANPTKSSRDIVDDLATRYSWTPTEQRDRVNVVRGMRAMAAAFSARIRRQLPFNRTDADIQRFLSVVEGECQVMEGHISDEFTN